MRKEKNAAVILAALLKWIFHNLKSSKKKGCSLIVKLAMRFLTQTDCKVLFKFIYNLGIWGMITIFKFNRRVKSGDFFPAFFVISLTNSCNLSCRGCWVSTKAPKTEISYETLCSIIDECKSKGTRFFGLLGGEPLLYPRLMDVIKKYPECYFQIFTNGTFITDEVAAEFRRLGNVTPLISIEGLEKESDIRRCGSNVFDSSMSGLESCTNNKLITGVCASICKTNIDELVSDEYIERLIKNKVSYVWYYIYRPTGENPDPELALSKAEILRLREFIVNARIKHAIIVVDAYWDGNGNAVCPAAMGLSHHINSAGDIEFCPPVQFAKSNVNRDGSLSEIMKNDEFLSNLRKLAASETRGCILLENPGLLESYMKNENALDSSLRGSFMAELASMKKHPDHHIPGKEIREKSLMYRFAKKFSFFGFGAYG